MRYRLVLIIALMLCTACSAAPQTPLATTPAARPITALRTPTLAVASTPEPMIISPTPIRADDPRLPDPILTEAPYVAAQLAYYPLSTDAGEVFHWTADGRFILYSYRPPPPTRYGNTVLALFDTQERSSQMIVDDVYHLDRYQHVFPVWDDEHAALLYLQYVSDATATLRAVDRNGIEQRIFRSDIFVTDGWEIYREDARTHANAAPFSIFDISVAPNGRVGIVSDTHVLSLRLNEPDRQWPLSASIQQRLASLQASDYHQLWLAPDGIHYALAITETLSIFQGDQPEPLAAFDYATEPYGFRPVLAIELQWAPDSQSYLFHFTYTENVGREERYGSYLQRLNDTTLHDLLPDRWLPSIPGNSGEMYHIAWASDSQWIVVSSFSERQCGGTPAGCINTQVIVNPVERQARIVWAGTNVGNRARWSPDRTQIAQICSFETETAYLCILTLRDQAETSLPGQPNNRVQLVGLARF